MPFLATGVILGFAVGGIVSMVRSAAKGYSAGAQVGYLGLFGAMIGGLLAALAYVWADRR